MLQKARVIGFILASLVGWSTVGAGRAATFSISPQTAALRTGQLQQFRATSTNGMLASVRWSVAPAVGSISATGVYTPPGWIAGTQNVTIVATSTTDGTQQSAAVTVLPNVTVTVTPPQTAMYGGQSQTLTATVTSSIPFSPAVVWSLRPGIGVLTPNGNTVTYTAPAVVTAPQLIEIRATCSANAGYAAVSRISLTPRIDVSLSPGAASLRGSERQQFKAVVTGTANQNVSWSLDAPVGSISSTGLYSAPPQVSARQSVAVVARSVADPTKSARATITLEPPAPTLWSIGYYSPLGNPPLPVEAIQWKGLTHVAQWAALVRPDGTLDLATQEVAATAAQLTQAAHAHNVKAILSLAQITWNGPTTAFREAATNHLPALVDNVISVVNAYGFDGVDINWEPFTPEIEGAAMQAFSSALRKQLGSAILTTAAYHGHAGFWKGIHPTFDRINFMSYDMSGPSNPYLWFNAALYSSDPAVYSLDRIAGIALAAGLPASKIGMGLPFYGYVWTGGVLASDSTKGISGPREVWAAGRCPISRGAGYNILLSTITAQNARWDAEAAVPYLSNPGAAAAQYSYTTYDDPASITAKARYVAGRQLGGWIIWHIGMDYFPGASHPHPLLDAVSVALP